MSIVFVFGFIPICIYMLYLIYIVAFILSFIYLCLRWQNPVGGREKQRLLALILKKQTEREASFGVLRTKLNLDNKDACNFKRIVSLSFDELKKELQGGNFTAVDALNAFTWKALEINEEFNCVTEFNQHAWAIAQDLDAKFATDGPAGPLHGIPFCVKDDFDIAGMDSTLGLAQNLYKPAGRNAVLVQCLVDLGAVPFCKTNLPQTTLSNGSHNPIFGATKNCLRSNLSPAGSSSGTASLIGAGGAIFGLGSDLGGSVRAPAHNCGISAIRPTIGRLSSKGIKAALPTIGVTIVPGILAKDPTTVLGIFQLLVQDRKQHLMDVTLPPMIWNNQMFSSQDKLTIGYIKSFPFYPAVGDTCKLIQEAADNLVKLGHETKEFDLPEATELSNLFTEICLADEGDTLRRVLKSEPVISPDISETWSKILEPNWTEKLSNILKSKSDDSTLWQAWARRDELRDQVLGSMESQNISAIISPVFPFPAVSPQDTSKLLSASYTMIWSVLDFPVVVIKCGTESGRSLKETGPNILPDLKNSIGMPIGVQIISRPFQEELCLKIAKQLHSLYTQIQ